MFGALNKVLKKIVGDKAEKDLKSIEPYVGQVNEVFVTLANISSDELRERVDALRSRINNHTDSLEEETRALKSEAESLGDAEIDRKEVIYDRVDALKLEIDNKLEEVLMEILPEAFAVVKETARRWAEDGQIEVTARQHDRDIAAQRDGVEIVGDKAIWSNKWTAAGADIVWNMVHYDVQIIGGVALHQGKIAEMQTGEGKTLVSTLPIFLNALTGKGVHLVTVNDYLSRRDAEWMGPLHEFHGLTVDCIDKHQPNTEERRNAYKADITYGTNNGFGFDYLRDNMAKSVHSLVQHKLHYAIVDEVDSVLIDEARTPLIISGAAPKGDIHEFDDLKPRVGNLHSEQKKLVTGFISEAKQRLKGVSDSSASKEDITEGGLSLYRAFRGLPKNKALIKFLSEPGIKQVLLKTEAYYLQDNSREMYKADEPLLFAIDEKNNQVELTEKGIVFMSKNMEDDDFFVLPDVATRIAEIDNSGKGEEVIIQEKGTLMQDFNVKSERIHTINQLLKAYALFEKEVDYVVMENKVKIVDEQTGRIMDGRRYSDGLHQAIESKENVTVEAATQTYATVTLQNFFRMYHKLAGMTGTAETEAGELWDIYKLDVMVIPTNRPIQRKDDEDMVYRTVREKFNAVTEEVIKLKEQGRPVLVGTTTVEVSELLSRTLSMRKIEHNVLNAKQHQREAEIVAQAGQSGQITIATNMAGRGTDIKLSPEVIAAGGLAIIGTERHDSRRVDRQLRGRAGRQGDPGSSQFFVSLEDELMRLFGMDRTAKLMDRLGVKEGEVIQHSMISKSIERAQKKVEENNFGIRKRLLEFDDVMNSQREVIYKRRRHALFGERVKLDIANMFYDLSELVVLAHNQDQGFENLELDLIQRFGIKAPFTKEQYTKSPPEALSARLYEVITERYEQKVNETAQQALPVIQRVYEDQSNSFRDMAVPFTDGKKTLQIIADIEKSYKTQGKELIDALERNVTLAIIDEEWKIHLREMDSLRSNVHFASHEQKDPLLIYKFESYELFKQMVSKVNSDVASFLNKCALPSNNQGAQRVDAQRTQRSSGGQNVSESKANVQNMAERSMAASRQQSGQAQQERPKVVQQVRSEPKVGRNEPCPCGSGKKFKQCHGKVA